MTQDELAAIVEGIAPVVRDFVKTALGDVAARVQVLDTQLAGLVTATTEIGTMRERLAVLETRAPVPGPTGPAGQNGSDGLGVDDLAIEQVDDATVRVKATHGDTVKVIGTVRFPVARVTGDYEPGREYLPGDLVRHKNAIWHCRVATTVAPGATTYDATGKPAGPQGKDFWTLLLRDGKRV
jgi:hypothetical protein